MGHSLSSQMLSPPSLPSPCHPFTSRPSQPQPLTNHLVTLQRPPVSPLPPTQMASASSPSPWTAAVSARDPIILETSCPRSIGISLPWPPSSSHYFSVAHRGISLARFLLPFLPARLSSSLPRPPATSRRQPSSVRCAQQPAFALRPPFHLPARALPRVRLLLALQDQAAGPASRPPTFPGLADCPARNPLLFLPQSTSVTMLVSIPSLDLPLALPPTPLTSTWTLPAGSYRLSQSPILQCHVLRCRVQVPELSHLAHEAASALGRRSGPSRWAPTRPASLHCY